MRKLKITEMNRLTPEEFKKSTKIPLVVVLDNVRSLHNVGSVFRTGDAFVIEAVYLCGITSTHLMPRFIKPHWAPKIQLNGSISKTHTML